MSIAYYKILQCICSTTKALCRLSSLIQWGVSRSPNLCQERLLSLRYRLPAWAFRFQRLNFFSRWQSVERRTEKLCYVVQLSLRRGTAGRKKYRDLRIPTREHCSSSERNGLKARVGCGGLRLRRYSLPLRDWNFVSQSVNPAFRRGLFGRRLIRPDSERRTASVLLASPGTPAFGL